MLISVDILRLKDHLEYLDNELRIAANIEEMLKTERQLALRAEDSEFLMRRIREMREISDRIYQRKCLLEQTIEDLSEAKHRLGNRISESRHHLMKSK